MATISTVGELRELLEDLEDDMPLHVAIQPSYPLAVSLKAVTVLEDDLDRPGAVWLATGDHPANGSPYAPADAWNG